jgi:hypothetical protein
VIFVVVCESCSILWSCFVSISSCAFSVLPPRLRSWFGFFSCYAHEQELIKFSHFAASGFRFARENSFSRRSCFACEVYASASSCSHLSFLWQKPVRYHFPARVFSSAADLRPRLIFTTRPGPSFL